MFVKCKKNQKLEISSLFKMTKTVTITEPQTTQDGLFRYFDKI